jgi:hypothetical protein
VHDLIAAFGAKAGVGAAAWSDVRAGAGASSPPPLPAVPPPPLPEHMTRQQRLAADAKRYAQEVAEQAVAGARKIAQQTAGAVGDTIKELRRDDHGRSMRHRRAMAKLRGRFHWPPRVSRHPAGAPRRASGWRAALTVVGGVVVGLVVLGLVTGLLLAPMAPSFAEMPVATVSVAHPAPPVPVDTSRRPTFTRFGVPRRYTDLVATSEPAWAALADRDPDRAARALEERLQQLRDRVPFQPLARAVADDLPTFGGMRRLPAPQQLQVDVLLAEVLGARDFDDEVAVRFQALGPVALASVAERLAQIPFTGTADLEHARRLHAILQRATGCHEMPLVDSGSPAAIARGNRHVGELWLWFLNEVAHTERTWNAYRTLRGGR